MSTEKNTLVETKSVSQVYTRREWPLVGSLFDFMSDDGMGFLLETSRKSDISRFHLGPIPMVLFNRAE